MCRCACGGHESVSRKKDASNGACTHHHRLLAKKTRFASCPDKMAAARRKGKWTGGPPPLGYDVVDRKLVVNESGWLAAAAQRR
jgi:hypothetical protein